MGRNVRTRYGRRRRSMEGKEGKGNKVGEGRGGNKEKCDNII